MLPVYVGFQETTTPAGIPAQTVTPVPVQNMSSNDNAEVEEKRRQRAEAMAKRFGLGPQINSSTVTSSHETSTHQQTVTPTAPASSSTHPSTHVRFLFVMPP
jgi:hypothetical protein